MVEFVGFRPKGGPPRLVPATAFDLEQLERIRAGDRAGKITFTFSRSTQRNRWYRGFVSIVADGVGVAPGILHAELKFKAGLVQQVLTSKTLGIAVQLESTAFAAMDETRFIEFVDLAVEIAFRDYLPGVKRKDVLRRVEEMVGPRPE